MPDRLTELQRQRALAAEQLAWFDREIAKETGQKPGAPTMSVASVAPAAPVATATTPTAEEILAQFQKPAQSSAKDLKSGCYLYFAFALGMLVICVVAAYYLYINLRQ